MNRSTGTEVEETADPAAASQSSIRARSTMFELDRAECLRLLDATDIGRVVVNVPGWDPVIRPVNYVFDRPSQSVVMRSADGLKRHALLRSARAAFEIDGTDPMERVGWSVIIVGMTEEVTNPAELRRIDKLGLEPWAQDDNGCWIRIRANAVSGRRILAGHVSWP